MRSIGQKQRIAISWKSPKEDYYDWELIPLLPIDESDETQPLWASSWCSEEPE